MSEFYTDSLGRRRDLRADMRTLATRDPRWKRALAAYDKPAPSKPKADAKSVADAKLVAKLIAKGRHRAAEELLGAAPGSLGGYGNSKADVAAFAAAEPEMAAQFGLAPKAKQQPRLEGNLFFLGEAPAKAPVRRAEPQPQARVESNVLVLGDTRGAK